jgi:hypothetical protein
MDEYDPLKDQIEILENVLHFVSDELSRMPYNERSGSDRIQSLLDELYDVLDRHGYKGIVKLVGDVDPENRDPDSKGMAFDPNGDYYLFKK